MYTSIVTSKGTITIPAKLRKLINIKPSDKVSFSVHNSQLIIEKTPSIDELAGSLHNSSVRPITQKEMDKLTEQMLSEEW